MPSASTFDTSNAPPLPTGGTTQQTGTPPVPPNGSGSPSSNATQSGWAFPADSDATDGDIVGVVADVTGPDPTVPPTFAIADGNTGGAFAIDATTGVVTVANAAALASAANGTLSLTVSATFGTVAVACAVAITVEEPPQNAPADPAQVTTALNTLSEQLATAIAKLNPTLANGSVKGAIDKLNALGDLLTQVDQANTARINGTGTRPQLNAKISDYNTAVQNFTAATMAKVYKDVADVEKLAKQVSLLADQSGGDVFRFRGLAAVLSTVQANLAALQQKIAATSDRAKAIALTLPLGEPTLDTTSLDQVYAKIQASRDTLWNWTRPLFLAGGDIEDGGIPALNSYFGDFSTAFTGMDPGTAGSWASWANSLGSRLGVIGAAMIADAQAADPVSYSLELAKYESLHYDFLAAVRSAYANIPAAADALKAAKLAATADAAVNGVDDDFRFAGINAAINDLKSSANALGSGVQSLLDQINSLSAFFASQGPLSAQWPLIAYQENYTDLLAGMRTIYAANLANLTTL